MITSSPLADVHVSIWSSSLFLWIENFILIESQHLVYTAMSRIPGKWVSIILAWRKQGNYFFKKAVYVYDFHQVHSIEEKKMKNYPVQTGRCCKLYLAQPIQNCSCFRLTCIYLIIEWKELASHVGNTFIIIQSQPSLERNCKPQIQLVH
jgi:hypothetical protein